MLRPGSVGSFTAADHIAVLDAALAQIPPGHRDDLLVAVDGRPPHRPEHHRGARSAGDGSRQ